MALKVFRNSVDQVCFLAGNIQTFLFQEILESIIIKDTVEVLTDLELINTELLQTVINKSRQRGKIILCSKFHHRFLPVFQPRRQKRPAKCDMRWGTVTSIHPLTGFRFDPVVAMTMFALSSSSRAPFHFLISAPARFDIFGCNMQMGVSFAYLVHHIIFGLGRIFERSRIILFIERCSFQLRIMEGESYRCGMRCEAE